MNRIEILEKVHRIKQEKIASPKEEDYLEIIYELIKNKGYVKVKDVSKILNVKASSVTKMLKKLSEKSLINYEKYGGITLTVKGKKVAEEIIKKHKILIDFLLMLKINENEANIEAEGIEHIISEKTLIRIGKLYEFIKNNKKIEKELLKYISS